jgi:fatty-acyl-CoA synthase
MNGPFRAAGSDRRRAFFDEDGFLFIVDRQKDMYISGGENVYPAEVEAALAEMEAIAEVGGRRRARRRWGEVGRAYVIIRNGHELVAESVTAHCRARLAGTRCRPRSCSPTHSEDRVGQGAEAYPARACAR